MTEQSKRMRQETLDEEPQLMMTPMVDIVFQLLIFFMLACRFRTTEGEMRAFLPKNRGPGTVGKGIVHLNKLRVKLLWVEPDSFRETRDPVNGRVLLKIKDVSYPCVTNAFGEVTPDYDRLYRKICQLRDNFRPTATYRTLPVIIDARAPVPFKHVMSVVNECARARIEDITFAAPEIPY